MLFEHEASDRPMVGVDRQLAVLEEIETGPGDTRNLVVEKSGGGGAMGGTVIRVGYQLFELFRYPSISFESLLVGHCSLSELGIRSQELGIPVRPPPELDDMGWVGENSSFLILHSSFSWSHLLRDWDAEQPFEENPHL
jgi:hypothetical protein